MKAPMTTGRLTLNSCAVEQPLELRILVHRLSTSFNTGPWLVVREVYASYFLLISIYRVGKSYVGADTKK